ncbi:MAG: hypothetical protein A3I66_10135 [Burkholderiales bacterium RIFCSPLOWO2_02_FULL_57_36]|nr:MAG: hypothetical protein A3I66_10135 [Burkholderiales bacterium RIFCSPLOWO2_02_FULL_57_36]
MTRRHFFMAVAVVIAGWLALFGDKTPTSGIAEPAARSAAPANAPAPAAVVRVAQTGPSTGSGKLKPEVMILALQPRETLIGAGEIGAAERTNQLFANQTWTPPPPPPPKPLPPPPPTAPPLPFTYLGKKIEDGIWEAYLARDDQTFIVRDKTVIENTYRVDSIKPPTLSLTYLPLNQVQTVTIGGTD